MQTLQGALMAVEVSVKNQDFSQNELKMNSLCKYCADAQIRAV